MKGLKSILDQDQMNDIYSSFKKNYKTRKKFSLKEKPMAKYKTAKDIKGAFKTAEDIHELRTATEKSTPEVKRSFQKMAANEFESMVSKGSIEGKRLKGKDLVQILTDETNYKKSVELIGQENTDALIARGKEFSSKEIDMGKVVKFAGLAVRGIVGSKTLQAIKILKG